jgi:hypothetical protein
MTKLVKVEADFKQILNNVFQAIEGAQEMDYWGLMDALHVMYHSGDGASYAWQNLILATSWTKTQTWEDVLLYLTRAAMDFRRNGMGECAEIIQSYVDSHSQSLNLGG